MKKKSTIREMFSGIRGNYEQVPLSENYHKALDKKANAIDALLAELTPHQQKLFDEAYEFIGDYCAIYAEDHFVEGFKFGVLTGIEVAEK